LSAKADDPNKPFIPSNVRERLDNISYFMREYGDSKTAQNPDIQRHLNNETNKLLDQINEERQKGKPKKRER
jgi:hypothetical protein